MNIDVTRLDFPAVDSLPLEIVERKGIGHPDTICDALVEEMSSELSRFYVERWSMSSRLRTHPVTPIGN